MSSKEFNFTLCIVYSPRLTSIGKFKTFPIPLSHNLSVNILIDLTLRCFDIVFQRLYFSIALKGDFPCPIAVKFSSVIGYGLKFVKMLFE